MKRIVVGTFAQCMCVINRSEKLGDAGYDHYDLHETTDEERSEAVVERTPGKRTAYNSTESSVGNYFKHLEKDNLYTLTLYRDNKTRKTDGDYNRAMKPLRT